MSLVSSEQPESAVIRGIKTAGVGKKGSRPLDAALARDILAELRTEQVPEASIGALFAGLHLKGITPPEEILDGYFKSPGTLTDPGQLAGALCGDVPQFVRDICVRLLRQDELDRTVARKLGDFLMSDLPGDRTRGLAAIALRVRYETSAEYLGLLESITATMAPGFQGSLPVGEPLIQLAEPFDGVDRSYLITPLLARFLQKHGYRVVTLCGRNPGPKTGNTVLDIAGGLEGQLADHLDELAWPKPEYGWFLHQKDMSPALDRWVDIRRCIAKRPFTATLEKLLNPCHARILVASAFHPPYGDKMADIAEAADIAGAVIVRNGMEGTTAFALKRPVKILCSARQADGSFRRHEFDFDPVQHLGYEVPTEERRERPSKDENIRFIRQTVATGKSGNELFDLRVRVTCAGWQQAVEWIEENLTS